MTEEKIGLVLEGGGVKGAYQAGVLCAIDRAGGKFAGAAGTSIGAINAALYAQGGAELVIKMWSEVRLCTVFDLDADVLVKLKNRSIDREAIKYLGKKLVTLRKTLKNSYEKTQKFFASKVREEDMRASGITLGLVAYCLSDRQANELLMDEVPEGRLVDFLVASATFPLFPPKEIDGKKYIDGGVYDNMPIDLLPRDGFNKQLVIRTNPMDKKPKHKGKVRQDEDLFVIAPDEELAHVLEFTSEKVAALVAKGIEDGGKALEAGLREFLGLDEASGTQQDA